MLYILSVDARDGALRVQGFRSTIFTCKKAGALSISLLGWIALPLNISAWTMYSDASMPASPLATADSVGYSCVIGAGCWVLMVVYLSGRLDEPRQDPDVRSGTQELPPDLLLTTPARGSSAQM
jgi:hypothetical protein